MLARGDDAVAGYLGNPAAFGALHPMAFHAFMLGLGTNNVYSSASQDLTNKYLVAQRMYGVPLLQPIPDLDRTEFAVLIGTNPQISQMSVVQAPKATQRLKAIVERGGRVVHVNPRRTETARAVGEQVFVRPGTDVFLLAAFLHQLLADDHVDHDLVREHTIGFGALAAVTAGWSPERSAEVTGVPADVLRELVTSYAAADGAVLYASTGLNMGPHGTLAYWFLNLINVVSGNLDRPGGAVVRTPRLDFPKMMKTTGLGMHRGRSRIGGFELILDTYPTSILPDEILTPGDGQVRALFVERRQPGAVGSQRTSHGSGARRARAPGLRRHVPQRDRQPCALSATGAVLARAARHPLRPRVRRAPVGPVDAVHPVGGATGRRAQRGVVDLPPPRHRVGVPMMGSRLQGFPLVVADALARLPKVGDRLELTDERLLNATLAAARFRPSKVRAARHGVRTDDGPPGGEFLGKRVMTDDGKVQLAPVDFVAHARTLDADFERERSTADHLRLITRRERRTHNSWTHNAEVFVGEAGTTNRVFVHPDDAARAGLADGDRAVVRSATGKISLPVALDEDLMPGVIAVPHGWGHGRADGLAVAMAAAGENANVLSPDGPDACEPLSGMARLTAIPVELERA